MKALGELHNMMDMALQHELLGSPGKPAAASMRGKGE